DPTVDISNLPKYQDVDLKQQVPPLYPRQQVPDTAASQLYSATPSETHGSFGFQRRVSPWSHARSHDSEADLVATVKYSPTATGHSLESLSLSDIGMMEDEEEVSGSSERNMHHGMALGSERNMHRHRTSHGSERNMHHHRTSHGSARNMHRRRSGGSAKEGPTLRDIYDLLKKTVSSIDAQRPHDVGAMSFSEEKFGTASSMHVPPQLQSGAHEWGEQRPAAPTPRRSRHFPTEYRDDAASESEESVPATAAAAAARHDGQSRVRAYLQRYISESAIGQSYASGHNAIAHRGSAPPVLSTREEPKAAEAKAEEEKDAEQILVDLLSFVSGNTSGDVATVLGRRLPAALGDKLRELARVLAQATNERKPANGNKPATPPLVDEAVQTETPAAAKDEGLRAELLRLQREILDKFDEYRAEVDQLRSEVRGSLPPLSPSVAPHDSVSAVAERMTSPAKAAYSVPTTARNRQRHMVQWLGQQQQQQQQGVAPFDSPTKRAPPSSSRGALNGSPLNNLGSSSRRSSARRKAGVAEDADDDVVGLGVPKRMGGGGDDVDDDDDALSDTSTTVPGRMAMRSPVDAAPLRQAVRHQAVSPWDGHSDLLAT
ncbi:hypothetical protein H4S07_005536, partial [Coemansia furcata]